ncbi:MAG TPA: hypothetical protein VM261_02970 [Kofleriaceae bacterium]|nr:hypothetical protein [Kofleriaceae bacterium]
MVAVACAATLVLASAACKKEPQTGATPSSGASGAGSASAAPEKPTPPTAAAAMANAPSPDDCDALGAKTAMLSMGETPPDTKPGRAARLQEISDEAGRAIATLCKTDGWTSEAVACGLAAKDPARECDDKLTDVQKNKMRVAVMAIFSKAAPP